MDIKLNIKLLKKSIEHWEDNVKHKNMRGITLVSGSCALCVEFNVSVNSIADHCEGCCIYDKTGEKFCSGTAYRVLRFQLGSRKGIQRQEVEIMLQFLKDLLTELESKV